MYLDVQVKKKNEKEKRKGKDTQATFNKYICFPIYDQETPFFKL